MLLQGKIDSSYTKVGIVGVPPVDIIRQCNQHDVEIFDLDEPLVKAPLDTTAPYVPQVYCAILRTAVQNGLHLTNLDAIFIDVGSGKCDCAAHIATILEDILSIPVFFTKNQDSVDFGTPICQSNLPLLEKLQTITHRVKLAEMPKNNPPAVQAKAGFWGVPPRDFSILELFPATTHVFGWTRCMENKTPDNVKLEALYNADIPTVFFAQSFCAKTATAQFLAQKHPHGLYLDIDVTASSSAKSKIQAFLELSGAMP